MTQGAARAVESSWSSREAELLHITLRLLQEKAYGGLTVDAVAAAAQASKATLYRRWPTKAELVLAAFTEGACEIVVAPATGSLREDLVQLGEAICDHARAHASTIRAVFTEVSRDAALNDAMQHQFLHQRRAAIEHVLGQAVGRGEIDATAINAELFDLMPCYLIFQPVYRIRRRRRCNQRRPLVRRPYEPFGVVGANPASDHRTPTRVLRGRALIFYETLFHLMEATRAEGAD
jgi:AcrR family transcriptional regulator